MRSRTDPMARACGVPTNHHHHHHNAACWRCSRPKTSHVKSSRRASQLKSAEVFPWLLANGQSRWKLAGERAEDKIQRNRRRANDREIPQRTTRLASSKCLFHPDIHLVRRVFCEGSSSRNITPMLVKTLLLHTSVEPHSRRALRTDSIFRILEELRTKTLALGVARHGKLPQLPATCCRILRWERGDYGDGFDPAVADREVNPIRIVLQPCQVRATWPQHSLS
mmetsp:Transcript_1629/g.6425  ORF Transcript_1629/g.6425 Transcript_1629/m.6425 type:complete len:224 (-) Transcript_1629:197-868(-)